MISVCLIEDSMYLQRLKLLNKKKYLPSYLKRLQPVGTPCMMSLQSVASLAVMHPSDAALATHLTATRINLINFIYFDSETVIYSVPQ